MGPRNAIRDSHRLGERTPRQQSYLHLRRFSGLHATLSLMLLALSGCSLINPHVKPVECLPSHYPNFVGMKCEDSAKTTVSAGNLEEAIDYGYRTRVAYEDAVGNQAKMRSGEALALFPVAASALFIGITGSSRASRDAVTALGAGSAGLFGLGTFFDSKDLQRVYLAGSQAVGCAISAMRPVLIGKEKFATFTTNLQNLSFLQLKVRNAIIRVENYLDGVTNKRSTTHDALGGSPLDATEEVKEAKKLLEETEQLVQSGYLLIERVEKSGLTLVTAIDAIRNQVDIQIVKTEPSLQSIQDSASGLKALSAKFAVPQVYKKKPATPITPSGAPLSESFTTTPPLTQLRSATTELENVIGKVSPVIYQVNEASKTSGDLKDCKVGENITGIKLQPASEAVGLEAGQTYRIAVTGGKPQYNATFIGANVVDGKVAKAEITNSVEGGVFFVIVKDGRKDSQDKAGDFQILISDATQENEKVVKFTRQ